MALQICTLPQFLLATHPIRFPSWATSIGPSLHRRSHFEERDQLHEFEESLLAGLPVGGQPIENQTVKIREGEIGRIETRGFTESGQVFRE
jgi:hypothetical protein